MSFLLEEKKKSVFMCLSWVSTAAFDVYICEFYLKSTLEINVGKK